MELGMNLEETRAAFGDTKDAESRQEEGEEVTLVLHTPSGPQRHSFKVGVTVAYVKMVLQQQHGCPMDKTLLKVGGKPLMDPLSLSDCAGISPGQEVAVDVVVSA